MVILQLWNWGVGQGVEGESGLVIFLNACYSLAACSNPAWWWLHTGGCACSLNFSCTIAQLFPIWQLLLQLLPTVATTLLHNYPITIAQPFLQLQRQLHNCTEWKIKDNSEAGAAATTLLHNYPITIAQPFLPTVATSAAQTALWGRNPISMHDILVHNCTHV